MSHHDKNDETTGMKAFLKPSMNWLFAFIPTALILEHAGKVPPSVIFFAAALAIVPIAALIVQSTEQIATRTGEAVGSKIGLIHVPSNTVLDIRYFHE